MKPFDTDRYSADWPPPAERLQPMEPDEGSFGMLGWVLGALAMGAILGGLAYGYAVAPRGAGCSGTSTACERAVAP